ncbi:MAG TPA: glycosyltransferase family 4 protein [Methanomassiliicoccales archaeon]|nr:glycosyltransferase family 4 protein [Methanomassiliicoccales archaeon]
MRIVQLNPYYYPFMGGIEHRIHHMSKRLARSHDVTVVTSRLEGTKEEERMDGYRVLRLKSKFFGDYNPPYVSSEGVLEALRGLRPDIVDFHYRWAPSYTRQVMRYDGKVVFTYHNTFGEGQGAMRVMSYLNDWSFMRKMRSFERVVCISEFVKNDNARHGFPMERMTVVPNGVEMPADSPQDLGFILSLGRIVHTKGLEYLIEAMRGLDAKLIIAGGGPEKEKLEALSRHHGLEGKVEMLGRVSEERKNELFATCSFFVMPSLFESYGIAAAEAMSYGKAVVATNVGGLPEVVADCGVLVPPRDPMALAKAIASLLEDEGRRIDLGRKARARASKYSWDRVAELQEQVYLEVVGKNK